MHRQLKGGRKRHTNIKACCRKNGEYQIGALAVLLIQTDPANLGCHVLTRVDTPSCGKCPLHMIPLISRHSTAKDSHGLHLQAKIPADFLRERRHLLEQHNNSSVYLGH